MIDKFDKYQTSGHDCKVRHRHNKRWIIISLEIDIRYRSFPVDEKRKEHEKRNKKIITDNVLIDKCTLIKSRRKREREKRGSGEKIDLYNDMNNVYGITENYLIHVLLFVINN